MCVSAGLGAANPSTPWVILVLESTTECALSDAMPLQERKKKKKKGHHGVHAHYPHSHHSDSPAEIPSVCAAGELGLLKEKQESQG